MTEAERQLRRKLAGLRTSQSHTQNAIWREATGPFAQRYRDKMKRVNRQVGVIENALNRLEKKSASQLAFPILLVTSGSRKEFVAFWDRLYSGYDEEFYKRNIGQPMTDARIKAWFEWKNGSVLSPLKAKSILRYSTPEERIPAGADIATSKAFLSKAGGAIWRIFWAHLQHPAEYPIYDQHVHRAMAFLHGWDHLEIPDRNPGKVQMYLEEYRPFFRSFRELPTRKVDRALWSFGRFLGLGYGRALLASGTTAI